MAEIDAEVDVGPLSVFAGLKAELGTLNKHNKQWEKHQEWLRSRVPSYVKQVEVVTIPTPTARTGLGITGPRPGFFMILRRLIIGGLTWKTTAAGTAECYITPLSSGNIGGLALSEMFDQAPSLPSVAFYSNTQVYIHANEHVEIIIDGGTAGQQYVATALIELWRTVAGETVFES